MEGGRSHFPCPPRRVQRNLPAWPRSGPWQATLPGRLWAGVLFFGTLTVLPSGLPTGPEWLTEKPLSLSLLPCPPAKSPGCDFSLGSGFQGLSGLEPERKTLETLGPSLLDPHAPPHPSLLLSLPKALMTPSGEKTEAWEGQPSCPTAHS